MSENQPLTIALVGCGLIAQTHLEAIDNVDLCSLAGVADINADQVNSVATQYGCKAYSDYRDLQKELKPDAVIVCTPPNTHLEIAGYFLDAGVHVLCEKPLAITTDEAEALIAKAAIAGRMLMMASKFRYVDDVIKAKSIVDSGVLGDIVLYENVFCSHVDMGSRWNSDPEVSGGGVLMDNGTHSIDIARYLLGDIVEVQAEAGHHVQEFAVEDTCRLYLRSAGGAMGAVDLSWSLHKERETYIELFGAEGVLLVGWKGSKYRQSNSKEWVSFGNGYNKLKAFSDQLSNFLRSIHGDEEALITEDDSLASVHVIDAAYRSMSVDKWMPVTGT